jgi:hypothetical protein
VQKEDRKQRALLAAGQGNRAPAVAHLEQPKKPELHD